MKALNVWVNEKGYKITAKDSDESLEIQNLFEQLGYKHAWDKKKLGYEPNHIFAKNGQLTWLHKDLLLYEKHEGTEVTLSQLRAFCINNKKISLQDEAESKEAQELLFELGVKRPDETQNIWHSHKVYGLLIVDSLLNYVFSETVFKDCSSKEISLNYLRDLVVLKRNDVADFTHAPSLGYKQYQSSNNEVYQYISGSWIYSHTMPCPEGKTKI